MYNDWTLGVAVRRDKINRASLNAHHRACQARASPSPFPFRFFLPHQSVIMPKTLRIIMLGYFLLTTGGDTKFADYSEELPAFPSPGPSSPTLAHSCDSGPMTTSAQLELLLTAHHKLVMAMQGQLHCQGRRYFRVYRVCRSAHSSLTLS